MATMRKQKVYISGPISGLKREDYIARFRKAEELIRAQGYDVVNPTRLLPCRLPWLFKLIGYDLTLLYDLYVLMSCDKIYKMPGWKESRGANIESCTAYHYGIYPLAPRITQVITNGLISFIIEGSKPVEQ